MSASSGEGGAAQDEDRLTGGSGADRAGNSLDLLTWGAAQDSFLFGEEPVQRAMTRSECADATDLAFESFCFDGIDWVR